MGVTAMIEKGSFADVIAAYKKYFPHHFKDEKYKWEAIKHFRNHWNIHAPNFKKILE